MNKLFIIQIALISKAISFILTCCYRLVNRKFTVFAQFNEKPSQKAHSQTCKLSFFALVLENLNCFWVNLFLVRGIFCKTESGYWW